MRTGALACCTLFALSACAHRGAADGIHEPWRFEAQAARGEVRVLPVLQLHDEIPVELGSFVGVTIPYERQRLRTLRTAQLGELPHALGERLPGAVNGQLGDTWDGQFRHSAWPMGAQEKLRAGLDAGRRNGVLDAVLGEIAQTGGAQATLFTWVRAVDGDPVSMHGFPGATVETPVGPVYVNHREEPYVATLDVGLALVTNDGEVLIRYEHQYRTLLSGGLGEVEAACDLAHNVAIDVTKVWATEAELSRTSALLAQESW